MVFLILPGLCQSIAVDMTETFQSSLFQGMGVLCLGSVQSHLKVEDKTTTISQKFAVVHEVPMEASYLNGTKHDTAIMSLLCVYLRERCRSAGRAALMEISAKMSTAVADR